MILKVGVGNPSNELTFIILLCVSICELFRLLKLDFYSVHFGKMLTTICLKFVLNNGQKVFKINVDC